MIFIILSALDVIAGAVIYSPSVASALISAILAFAVVLLGKGIWTIFSTATTGYAWHAWAGAVDIIGGAALVLMAYGLVSASHILGGIVMAKGAWYLARSILKF